MNNLLTVKEVMGILKVSRATVFNWMKAGKIRYSKAGRLIRIKGEDLNAFIDRTGRGKKIRTVNRDSGGHFRPAGFMDDQQRDVAEWIAYENRKCELYKEAAELMQMPQLLPYLRIEKLPNGNWHMYQDVAKFFFGFIAGVSFATKANKKTIDQALTILREALDIEKKQR